MANYTIKSGDTLGSIAAANKTSVGALAALNNIADVNKISAGTTLNLGGTATTAQPVAQPVTQNTPNLGISNSNSTMGSTPSTNSGSNFLSPTTLGSAILGSFVGPNAGNAPQSFANAYSATATIPSSIKPALLSSTTSALQSTPVNLTPTGGDLHTVTPLTVPPTPVDTTSARLAGYTAGTMNNYGSAQTLNDATGATKAAIDYSNSTNNNNSSDLTNRIAQQYGVDPSAIMSKLSTEGAETQNLNTQYDTAGKTQAAQDAYNNYNAASLALNQQLEQIRTMPGITKEQANQQIAEISKEGNANLANLAVINQAAQGNLSTAMNIVQMKLDQEFKPLQDQIDAIGKFNTINNANLSQSQQTQLENQRFVMQNNLNTLMSAKQNAHQFALQQGIQDPNVLNAIDAAQTPADVYAAVGGNANGLPQGSTQTSNINPQYAGYQAETVNGTSYVSQDKLTNLTPYQQQDAARQYAAAGVPVLTSGQTAVIQSIDTTRGNLSDLNTVTSRILGSGATGRIGSSIANFIGGALQTNPDVAAFNNYRQLAIGALKSLGAGTGGARITAGEIQTAQDNLPTIYDSLETAQKKSQILTSQLDKWQNELLPPKSGGGAVGGNGGGLYSF